MDPSLLTEARFSPGVGGCPTTLLPSFTNTYHRVATSTTDSSRRSPESGRSMTNVTLLVKGNVNFCQSRLLNSSLAHLLCLMPFLEVSLPELCGACLELPSFLKTFWRGSKDRGDKRKFHALAYSCLGKSFSMSNQDLYC
ncbi:protein CROC-4-like [Saccopteryx bilineata]|uniref:protein CROC-4-like n=1 Tax=Saccopteryx bilineata TaxID=59482 RepID=UPI00338F3475